MKKLSSKRIDMYDIGDGLTLMNIITKNDDGKMHQINSYIGIEGNGFVSVGVVQELDAPGAIFSYRSYVRMQEANISFFKEMFERNIGVR